jgi:hypothetical protein
LPRAQELRRNPGGKDLPQIEPRREPAAIAVWVECRLVGPHDAIEDLDPVWCNRGRVWRVSELSQKP